MSPLIKGPISYVHVSGVFLRNDSTPNFRPTLYAVYVTPEHLSNQQANTGQVNAGGEVRGLRRMTVGNSNGRSQNGGAFQSRLTLSLRHFADAVLEPI